MNNLLLTVITEDFNRAASKPIARRLTNVSLTKNPKTRPNLINKDNLSALDNYVKSKNSLVIINDLENDLFDDTVVTVFTQTKDKEMDFKKVATKLNDITEKNFPEKMRDLYIAVENAIKEISQRTSSKINRREFK